MPATMTRMDQTVNDDGNDKRDKDEDSISGRSAALYFDHDPSLAQLLVSHGIKVRDFIIVSFLSEQGPVTQAQLGRVVGLDTETMLQSIKRLSGAGLVVREPQSPAGDNDPKVRLTGRGQDIAGRIDERL